VVAIPGSNREINSGDVGRVIEVSKVVGIRSTQGAVQEYVQEFVVDGQRGIRNPVGMYGSKLEAEVYIVAGKLSAHMKTIDDCVEGAGLEVAGRVFLPIASGVAAASPSEKKSGTIVVDLGAGKTNTAVFGSGNLVRTKVLALGSDKITEDISTAFHVTEDVAEMIKREHGCARAAQVSRDSKVAVGGKKYNFGKKDVARVVEKRLGQILSLVKREMEESRFPQGLGETVILTGGGANLKGIEELASEKFNLPVRLGKPDGRVGQWGKIAGCPSYCTIGGLMQVAVDDREIERMAGASWKHPFAKIKSVARDFF